MIVPRVVIALSLLASAIQGSPCDKTKTVEPGGSDVVYESDYVFQTTIQTTIKTCDEQKSIVEDASDPQTVQVTFQSLYQSVTKVLEFVQSPSFNSDMASKHKTTVATLIVSYSKIVTAVYVHREKDIYQGCHETLHEITTCVQTVIDVYAEFKISLKGAVEEQGGIDAEAFQSLAIQLNFVDVEQNVVQEVDEPHYASRKHED